MLLKFGVTVNMCNQAKLPLPALQKESILSPTGCFQSGVFSTKVGAWTYKLRLHKKSQLPLP